MRFTHSKIYLAAILGFSFQLSCGEETQFAGSAAQQAAEVDPEGDGLGSSSDQVAKVPGEGPVVNSGNPDSVDAGGEGGTEPIIEIIIGDSKESLGEIPVLNIVREYVSGMTVPGKVEIDVMNDTIDQDYTLMKERITVKNTKDYEQMVKPPVTEMYTQGSAGANQMDTFDQIQTGVLDVLIVVDDSGSMGNERKNLANKIEPLLTYIGDAAWQIGIVTTDSSKPCLRALIKKGDANATEAFKIGIEDGRGSGNERGILTAAIGLGFDVTGDGFNNCTTNWIRDNSTIAVLIVSDEDNCSNGNCTDTPAWEDPKYLTDKLSSIRILKEDARVYGLISVPGTTCDSAYNVGTVYKKLIDLSGGLAGSICDADYSTTLMQISQDVASILKAQFSLKLTPDAGSVKVYINGTLLPSGYSVAGQVITFEAAPPKDSQISVSYTTGATPRYSEFPLAEPIALNSMAVMINGAAVDANDYTVDYAQKTLTFKVIPVDNADVKASYRKEIELPKTYNIGMRAIEDTIKATVDSLDAAILSYDKTTGIAVLTVAPGEKAKIQFTFNTPELGNPIIDFAFTTPWNSVKDLSAKDADTDDDVKVTWANDVLSFDPASFIEGRKVIVTYRDESEGPNRIVELSTDPKDGLVTVTGLDADGANILCGADDVMIEGKKVTTKCDLTEAMKIIYDYKYDVQLKSSFAVEEIKNPESARWSVWVNEVLSIDFVREGNRITFPAPLAGGTVVKIEAKFDF